MSIPPYPGSDPGNTPFSTFDGPSNSTPRPIRYVWPKRIAVILAGLALVGGIGFGVKSLLPKDDKTATSQETVQSAPPAPGASSAPESPPTGAAQAPQSSPAAPMRLSQALTDSAGTLSSEQTAAVKTAVKSLQATRDVRLWVVYVEAFDSAPVEWARETRSLTKMGERDAVLAIATTQRKYAFLVAPAAANGSEEAVNELRRNDIEPKLRDSDFAGAAVAAAAGLEALR